MKRSPIKRSTNPLKRTKLRCVSAKHSKALKEYAKLRKDYLAEHPFCQVGEVIQFDYEDCMSASCDVHHVNKRGPYLNDTSTWLATCRACHNFVHHNPSIARKRGLLK